MDNKIFFIEEYFYPDGWGGSQITRDIALKLQNSDWYVTTFCGSKPYIKIENNLDKDPRLFGIKINRQYVPFKSNNFFLKLVNNLFFSLQIFFKFFFIEKPSLILVQTNPPPVILVASFFSLIWNVPLVIIAMDLYPDVLIKNVNNKNKNFLSKLLTKPFNFAYLSAKEVIALGPSMRQKLVKRGCEFKKIKIINNWATGNLEVVKGKENKLRDDWNIYAKNVILYSGNLGVAHEWQTLLYALKKSKIRPYDLQIIFISSGNKVNLAKQYSLENLFKDSVIFKSPVDYQSLPHSFGLADIGLVTLRREFDGLVVPSKFYGYISRGIPVMYIGPHSDLSSLISNHSCGICFKNNQIKEVADFLSNIAYSKFDLKKYSLKAREEYLNHFSSKIALENYANLLCKYKKV